ncbi:MAG: hypothetical protein GXP56_05915 [Deltaproteobacteria bacterium]|nr:hypothetical protein [Deltaproteobacteria bacterium]
MKKILLVFIVLLISGIPVFAQDLQVQNVTEDVLTAYRNRDIDLLKKHASAILKVSISQNYFKGESIRGDLKAADNWDGKIKEIRYDSKNMMGANVLMATVYFADVTGTDEMYAVLLSNFNNTGWVIFGNGISKITKDEFEKLSKTIPVPPADTSIKSKKKVKNKFSIEMANGEKLDNVPEEKIDGYFNQLNEDNFYIILSDGKNYLQAAYSDAGYTVEYQDEKGHFTAHELLSKDETLTLFKQYHEGKEDWNKGIVWDKD